jgi:hypothetical protein
MKRKTLLGGPQGCTTGASGAFRTVSLGTSVNLGSARRCVEGVRPCMGCPMLATMMT